MVICIRAVFRHKYKNSIILKDKKGDWDEKEKTSSTFNYVFSIYSDTSDKSNSKQHYYCRCPWRRTDSNGGHKDNNNKSGLGYYHYHCGGNPPHLHSNGSCPYSSGTQTPQTPQTQAVPETTQEQPQIEYGWQEDNIGWWYLNPDGSYPKSTWRLINDKYYCFDEKGYLYINTYTPDGNWVDENGVYNK